MNVIVDRRMLRYVPSFCLPCLKRAVAEAEAAVARDKE